MLTKFAARGEAVAPALRVRSFQLSKHGRYTAQAITRRREVRALLKSVKQLVEVA
jgi:hypothetical protein